MRIESTRTGLASDVLLLWRHRVTVIVTTLACGLIGYFASVSGRDLFEATATTVKAGDPTLVNMVPYKVLMDRPELAAQVVREFSLDRGPYKISTEGIPGTNVMLVKVASPDSALSARAANRYAELAIEVVERDGKARAAVAREKVKADNERGLQLAEAADRAVRDRTEPRVDAESEFARREIERDALRNAYLDGVKRLERTVALLQVTMQIQQPAVPPDHPLPRHALRNAIMSLTAGLLLSLFAVLFVRVILFPAPR